jgi:hypothetical protein
LKENGELSDCFQSVTVSFDCTVANTYPSVEFAEQFKKHRPRTWLDKWIARGAIHLFSRGSLRGPAALFVCHESRQLALQRYQPAFSSVTVEVHNAFFSPPYPGRWTIRKLEDTRRWKDRKFGKKQFWIDFERDIVVVDTMKRMGEDNPYYLFVPLHYPLGMIRTFAAEDGQKIKRLAIGGGRTPTTGDMIDAWCRGPLCHHSDTLMGRQVDIGEHNWEYLMGFQSLEELLLDDTFEGDKFKVIPKECFFLNSDYAKETILTSLENSREQGPEWGAEVPNLRILEEADWNEYL